MRVMTFNIAHGRRVDGGVALERIAGVIGSSDVDVAGLQEVDRHYGPRSGFVDQAAWLSQELQMRVVFGANVDQDPLGPGRPRRQYGNAILSRWPILDWDNTLLPRRADHEPRGLLRARISVRGGPVQLYSTHLNHDTPPERLDQAEAIVAGLSAVTEPILLVGDLNAVPGTAEIAVLTKRLSDTWSVAGSGAGATYPRERPVRRIDYIAASDAISVQAVTVVPSPSAAPVSDHLPVMAEVSIRRRRL
jgi:endonuclease/exonuclease/phosphatase family metal-dependent hydrolase